jgi:AcrR family transcriptional regulator
VKEVAAAAGVSHTLIYRHFPEGGKEELIAEAYAELFRGVAKEDVDRVIDVIAAGVDVRGELRKVARGIFDPRRGTRRAARLEALSQIRLNPYLEARIETMRRELVQHAADRIVALGFGVHPRRARAISMMTQAVPLGITAIAGADVTKADREAIADLWADTIVTWMLESQAEMGSGRTRSTDV